MRPAPRFTSARAAEEYLLSFVNYEVRTRYRRNTRTHDLARFQRLLGELGWRPAAVPTVHVGGTNGKGTVATLTDRILRAGGLHCGLYTSPHLHSMRERVRLDGRPIGRGTFRRAVERIAAGFRARPGSGFRTTFEHLTALAFLSFQEAGVDWAVVEVGLGGRLDATNVLPPGLAVLTPISLDHEHVLGRTIGRIASDKARIVKPGGTVFLLPQLPAARRAIQRRARSTGAAVVPVEEAVQVRRVGATPQGTTWEITGRRRYGRVRTRLLGDHQGANLAAAVAVAERILPAARVGTAVSTALRGAVVPGRLEVFRAGGVQYLLDGGHNPAAARTIRRALDLHYPGARITAVVGMARDKAHKAFLAELEGRVERFLFTAYANPRAASPRDLARSGPGGSSWVGGVDQALEEAKRTRPDLVLVAGSFLLVAEARERLGRRTA